MTLIFPFVPGGFYSQTDIRKKLKLGHSGGIRSSIKNNLIAVFMNARESAPLPSKDKNGRFNIYHDRYDYNAGLYYYTGAGQTGDQKLSRTNLSLTNAKKLKKKIHFFHQHNTGSKHEYIGEVEVVGEGTERQRDRKGKYRKVIVFYLKPLSKIITSDEDAISREAESDIGILKKPKRSRSEIESDLDKINKKILEAGPKKGSTSRTKDENQRNREIVTMLKILHKKCMVCKIPHFKTENNTTYSEAHHLIPWATSHDDARENLAVLCPTCHKKFDYATKPTKISMYDQLVKNFPDEEFKTPPDIT